jgi:prophage maintenance system killer protein
LTHVLSRTQCEDAWHETFQEVLRWFLELRGADIDAVTNVVDGVIAGRFSSWTEPSKEEIQNACSSIGAAVRDAARPTDVLAGWLTLREEPATLPEPRRNHRALDDPHRRYIETHDRARDLVRAARLSAALDAARALASRGEALTFEKFAEIQSLVLGEAAMFRTGPAYAKEGREMYSLASDTAVRFSRALAEATEGGAPLAWRAARLYLDVLFFHPFVDGNARAARLAMDYLLTREGHGLHAAAPLFKTPFAWGPEVLRNAALAFHELIAPLGPSGR